MSYSLNSLKGVYIGVYIGDYIGDYIGVIKGDTRSLECRYMGFRAWFWGLRPAPSVPFVLPCRLVGGGTHGVVYKEPWF